MKSIFLVDDAKKSVLHLLLLLLFVAACYYVSADLGLRLATISKTASPVWPATGVAIAAVLFGGYRILPGIFVGAALANVVAGSPSTVALAIALGNTLEALIGALVFTKISGSSQFTFLSEAVGIVAASVFAPVISASAGVLALTTSGLLQPDQSIVVWTTWWVGDFLGGLIVTLPALVFFRTITEKDLRIRDVGRNLLALGIGVAATASIFSTQSPDWAIFTMFPILLGIVWFLGISSIHVALLSVSSVSIWLTFYQSGPFIAETINQSLINMQLFLAGLAVTTHFVCGLKREGDFKTPSSILIVGWVVTSILCVVFKDFERNQDNKRFEKLVTLATDNIHDQLDLHIRNLAAGAGLFAASHLVTHDEWADFFSVLTKRMDWKATRGLGAVLAVPASERESFERKVRQAELPEFKIKPFAGHTLVESNETHYVTRFIAPLEPNYPALGLDIASESVRRAGADLARDSGEPAMSGKIVLVQDPSLRPGFLLFYPMYKKNAGVDSVIDRQHALFGFSYAPVIFEELFEESLKGRMDEIDVRVFLGTDMKPDNLVYSDEPTIAKANAFSEGHSEVLELAQSAFSVEWKKSEHFVSRSGIYVAWTSFAGVMLTLLFAALGSNLKFTLRKAESIAEQMTAALREKESILLAASAQLSEKNEELEQYAYRTSHDLRSPLLSIGQLCDYAEEDLRDKNYDEAITNVVKVKSITKKLQNLVEDILTLTKSDFVNEGIDAFDFEAAITAAKVKFGLEIEGAAGLEFHIQLRHDRSLMVQPIRLSQVLDNLISNAIKYKDSSKPSPFVAVKTYNDVEYFYLSVQDNGIGIPVDRQNEVFGMFKRFHSRSTIGSGLGLYIVRKHLAKLGANIRFESSDAGTTFYLKFPLTET